MFTLLHELSVICEQTWIGYSLNGNIGPTKLLLLMEKYTLTFNKSVNSDYNQIFSYGWNNHIGTTKIFQSDPVLIRQ